MNKHPHDECQGKTFEELGKQQDDVIKYLVPLGVILLIVCVMFALKKLVAG